MIHSHASVLDCSRTADGTRSGAMVLVKHRRYGYALATNLPLISAPGTTGLLLEHTESPTSPQATLIRTRAEFTMSVNVGNPMSDVPPLGWWDATYVTLYAFWTPSNSSAGASSTGSSEHYLGSQFLAPKFTADPTDAGAYFVQWTTDDALATSTYRKDASAVTGPSVNFYVSIFDPLAALGGFYAAISINYGLRWFLIWGDSF
jgi:hypothetical protein